MKISKLTLILPLLFGISRTLSAATEHVALDRSTTDSFLIHTGVYTLSYDASTSGPTKGWVCIKRDSSTNGLATRFANGQGLDVTEAGAGEGDIYGWKDMRKDSRMFRALACEETSETVTVRLQTERQWAKFDSELRVFKQYPGLMQWRVLATAKEDRVFAGKSSPDCYFLADGSVTQWGERPQEVVRYSVHRGAGAPHVYFRHLAIQSYVFYFEDLSSLNDLYRLTQCDVPYDYPSDGNPGSVRMGKAQSWFQMSSPDGNNVQPMKPYEDKVEKYSEFGYERPSSYRIPKGAKIILADTYLYLKPAEKTDNITVCRNFVEMLADIFKFIHKPPVIPTDWSGEIVPQLVKDVMRPENSCMLKGKHVVPRAYVSYEHEDHQLWTIVQLLHPLELYVKRHPEQKDAVELRRRLNDALPEYIDKEWGGFINNPAPINQDQFFTVVYIFGPTVIIADLAKLGNENARLMLTGFRDRLLKMGKAYNYEMADIWLRDFSKQRSYFQSDAMCCYMYVMMALYDLSGGKDLECLEAAKSAAERLRLRCMDLAWQANMTATGMAACEQLAKATGDDKYRELAYVPLASLLREAWLWESDFGAGEYTTTFWGFCGCPAAPSTAEYEAHRARFHMKDYQAMASDHLPPNLNVMLMDSWKRGPTQSRFSLPPLLVKAGAQRFMAREGKSQTNCGEIRYDQMIPLEDVRATWGTDLEWWQNNTKLGAVGQEIYGAGGPIMYAVWQDEQADSARAGDTKTGSKGDQP